MATGQAPGTTSTIRLQPARPARPAGWPARRWVAAALVAVLMTLATAIPTDLIDTPMFTRDVPPSWWAWPVTLISACLAGLLAATYVRRPAPPETGAAAGAGSDTPVGSGAPEGSPASDGSAALERSEAPAGSERTALGALGALGTWFAVGCPVCNKLALLALGYSGALRFFGPVQGYLALASIALLAVALVLRVRRENRCPVPAGQAR